MKKIHETNMLNKYTKFATIQDGRHFPKSYIVLRYMIDGERHGFLHLGGNGKAPINCDGGFGMDSAIRRMIKDGLVTYHRAVHHEASPVFSGNPTINRNFVKVTDKGTDKYKRMSLKYKLRLSY